VLVSGHENVEQLRVGPCAIAFPSVLGANVVENQEVNFLQNDNSGVSALVALLPPPAANVFHQGGLAGVGKGDRVSLGECAAGGGCQVAFTTTSDMPRSVTTFACLRP
jgi:hypothetical protein